MKKIYLSLLALAFGTTVSNAQAVCDSTGNVVIYSNYDGGILHINVDQNIPNLKIGVCTYESVKIMISGTYVGNVTEVRYAGYNGSNDNCSLGVTNTSITGVTNNIDTIIIYPSAGYSNANGWSNLVCNYSCSSTTNQGGCNTPDQIVYYFVNAFGGTYRYHHTQYNCWTNVNNYNISSGGNCCIVPTTLGVANTQTHAKEKQFFPNPANGELNIRFYSNTAEHQVEVFNLMGAKVASMNFAADAEKGKIDLKNFAAGIYFVKMKEGDNTITEKIVVE